MRLREGGFGDPIKAHVNRQILPLRNLSAKATDRRLQSEIFEPGRMQPVGQCLNIVLKTRNLCASFFDRWLVFASEGERSSFTVLGLLPASQDVD